MDESRFNLESDGRCIFTWKEPGTRFHSWYIRERDAYGSYSVSIWGGISLNQCIDLHVFFCGNINAHTDRDDILDSYICPYAVAIGDAFVLQDDNTRPHTASIKRFSTCSGLLDHQAFSL
ncbi:transposable element Tc3 transposase [Trichonephila clavipes]|nr:transposable element Tc3 transposase [Trichonephila clavipes]